MGRYLKILVFCSIFAFKWVVLAQQQPTLSLSVANTNLQTGQDYEITIRVDNAPEFWTADLALNYDSNLLYLVGTKSGSPITTGEIFAPESSVIVQNRVQNSRLEYVVSKIGETSPVKGSGIIGKFHIFPVAPGHTQITFSRAQLIALTSYNPNASNVGTVPITSTAVLLDLTISGNAVQPPTEATATPLPSETPTPVQGISGNLNQQATLVNITAAPVTTVPLATIAIPVENETSSQSTVLMVAIIMTVIAGLGLVIAFFLWRRSQNR